MIEGYATADQISMFYQTTVGDYCKNDKAFCDKLQDYISQNEKWILDQSKEDSDSYWYQVKIFVYKVLLVYQVCKKMGQNR